MKTQVLAAFLVAITASCTAGQGTPSAAIKPIEKEEILPTYREAPYPSSGKIRFKAPSFVWMPAITARTGSNSFKFDYDTHYQVRISKDPNFKDNSTIVSPIQEWTFFNTHKVFEPGTWYWSYAYIKNGQTTWHPTIEFEVTGNETDFVTPHFDQLVEGIGKAHPRVLATPDNLGKIELPKALLENLKSRIDPVLDKAMPELIYNNKEVMAEKRRELNDERYQMFISKRTRDNAKKFSKDTSEVIMLYAATGEKRYLENALKRYQHFAESYKRIVEAGQWIDFTEVAFHAVEAEIFDVAYEHLSEEQRVKIVKHLAVSQEKNYRKFLHVPAHLLHSSHYWQIEIRSFMLNSLVLLHHTPEAKKWLDYVYNLFVLRVPTGSGDDGGWGPGNKYFSVNQETLFILPYLLTRYTGFDFFSKPWYDNVRAYITYSSPVIHPAGAYGSASYATGENMIPLVTSLNRVKPDIYGQHYEDLFKRKGKTRNKPAEKIKMTWFASQPLDIKKPPIKDIDKPLAMGFPDVGLVAMHTELEKLEENFMLSMRSSPYGTTGHAHAAQNAFNILYGGEPLFFHTGYYTNWADNHTIHSYRHTRAHNSILVDGIGQNFHSSGYGWLPRFLTGKKISYGLGDASRAYSGTIARDALAKNLKKYGIEPTPENGFGDPGVKKFRRHIFMLRPHIAVIYDDLEAEKPVEWTWLGNSRRQMTLGDDGQAKVENSNGVAQMKLFASTKYTQSLFDEFYAPVVDWQGKGAKLIPPDETSYHFKARTNKTDKARFLAVIRVDGKGKPLPEVIETEHGFKVAGWTIHAELNTNKPAAFTISNASDACISMGQVNVHCGGKNFVNSDPQATLLVEKDNGKFEVQQAVDQWPDAAVYY